MIPEASYLANHMATRSTYDEAWMAGLELQAFGADGYEAFRLVLEQGTSPARRAAAFWLSDEAEMVPADLFFLMATDEDSEVRFHAAYCLAYVQDARTLKTLRQLAHQDTCEEVRQCAIQSLYGAAKLNAHIEHVLADYDQSLKDKSPMVREEAVTHLANFLKSPDIHQAILLLERALHDTHTTVREQAEISLSVLKNEIWHDPVLL